MMQAMRNNLVEKTGHNLNHWIALVKYSGEEKHMAIIKYLKSEHGLTHGYAKFIAFKVREESKPINTGNDLVTELFKSPKEALKPIYETLVAQVDGFGEDVDFPPRIAYTTIRRSKQFAIFKPSMTDLLDIGLILKGLDKTYK